VTLTDPAPAPTQIEEPPVPPTPAWDEHQLPLPVGTRILHIGPHKTGTTAVQASLHIARSELERQGLYYASDYRHAMTAVLAALQLPNAWEDDKVPPPRWKWERLLAKARSTKADRVIFSSEFFADGKPDGIRKIVDELDPTRVHVVVTLRPLAKILPSQWQQWVQNQWTTPLDEFAQDVVENPGGTAGKLFWRRHRHDLLIKRWAEIVGPDRVTAVALDDRDHDMVLRVFERLTGLRTGTLQPDPTLSNRSMTLPEIEVLRAFNVAYKAEKLSRKVYSRVIRFGASGLMEARPPSPEEPRIELPESVREPIAAMARQIIDGIRASGVRVIGDLDRLAQVPEPSGRAGGPVAVSPEVGASAAMGVLIGAGLARGSGRILEELAEDEDGSPLKAPPMVQEPAELLRLSSTQLGVVLLRRTRAKVGRRLRPLKFWRR
jgi:hypothetical protein